VFSKAVARHAAEFLRTGRFGPQQD
jgi:hypothetical protein